VIPERSTRKYVKRDDFENIDIGMADFFSGFTLNTLVGALAGIEGAAPISPRMRLFDLM
jgi:hypothetical protein